MIYTRNVLFNALKLRPQIFDTMRTEAAVVGDTGKSTDFPLRANEYGEFEITSNFDTPCGAFHTNHFAI